MLVDISWLKKKIKAVNIMTNKFKNQTQTQTYLKTRHVFKSCNIYLKAECFRKLKFTLAKVKSE